MAYSRDFSRVSHVSLWHIIFRGLGRIQLYQKMDPVKKTKKAQIIGEYAVTFFVVTSVIIAMSVFMIRVFQARIFDARRYMVNTVKSAPHIGKIRLEYEPYYTNTDTLTDRTSSEEKSLLEGGHTGIFRKVWDDHTAAQTTSEQRPPKDAD